MNAGCEDQKNKLTQDPNEKGERLGSLYFVAYLVKDGKNGVARAKEVRSLLCHICASCKP